MEFSAKIGKRGGDLAFRIPARVVRALGIRAGDPVDFSVEDGRLIVRVETREEAAPLHFA